MNKLQAENKLFREHEQDELWELVSPKAETARQKPAGCEAAASLQAARLEAEAESLPRKMLPASSGPLETFLLLQKDAEERFPDLSKRKTYMRYPESGLAARLQSQEGQELSSDARARQLILKMCTDSETLARGGRAHTHTDTRTHRLADMWCGRCV